MSKSIIQEKKECYLCRVLYDSERTYGLEEHHCIPGTAHRRLCTKYGLTVWLCADHHRNGKNAAHRNIETMAFLKLTAQQAFEKKYSHEEFMNVFGKKSEVSREKKKDGTYEKPRLKEAHCTWSKNMPLPDPKVKKLKQWRKDPWCKKGYVIAKDSLYQGEDVMGFMVRRYTMLRI